MLIDKFLKCSKLCSFLEKLFEFENESRIWEFWLYKETFMNWNDFKLAVTPQQVNTEVLKKTETEIEQLLRKGVINNGIV